MDLADQELKDLKNLLEIGLAVESLSVIMAFCLKKEKTDTINKIKKLVTEFQESLTEPEKKELAEDMESMMRAKTEQIFSNLESTLTPEELNELLTSLQTDSQSKPPPF